MLCYFSGEYPLLRGEFLEAQSKLKDMGNFDHKSYWSAMVAPRFCDVFFWFGNDHLPFLATQVCGEWELLAVKES